MKKDIVLYIGVSLLLVEAIAIVLSSTIVTGNAVGSYLSHPVTILMVVFLCTLVALAIGLHWITHSPGPDEAAQKTTQTDRAIEARYLARSLGANESKDKIINRLEDEGFKRRDIDHMLDQLEHASGHV